MPSHPNQTRAPIATVTRLATVALALLLGLAGIGCEEGAGAVPVSQIAVDLVELDVQSACDAASNADGGDFRAEIEIREVTNEAFRKLGELPRLLIGQSHGPAVLPLDHFAEGELRQEDGRAIQVTVVFLEDDGGGTYDAYSQDPRLFIWSEDRQCWRDLRDESTCIAPGETAEFTTAFDDREGRICEAALHWDLSVDTVQRSPAEAHAGAWRSRNLMVDVLQVSGDNELYCRDAEFVIEDIGDGRLEGWGACGRRRLPSNVSPEFRVEAWFTSDRSIAGRLVFPSRDVEYVIPFEGTRHLNLVELTFSDTTPDVREGGDLGTLHWMGGATMVHVQ